jgi:hypothetical protein
MPCPALIGKINTAEALFSLLCVNLIAAGKAEESQTDNRNGKIRGFASSSSVKFYGEPSFLTE